MTTELRRPGDKSRELEYNERQATEETLDAVRKASEASLASLTGIFTTPRMQVPGIGTAAIYASGDAFGTVFDFAVPVEGVISTVMFYDLDDEGIAKELVLFDSSPTGTADNSAFNVSDADLQRIIGVVNVDTFYDFNANQLGIATPAIHYKATGGKFWCQVVTRGTDNIAAGSLPLVMLVVS